jgi:outer membrane protein OmpA-like peptidoglycan-associated protein
MRITHLLTATALAGALAVCADANAGGPYGVGGLSGGPSAGLSGGLGGGLVSGLGGGLDGVLSGGVDASLSGALPGGSEAGRAVAPRLRRSGPELRQTLHGATAVVRSAAVISSVAAPSLPRPVLVAPVVAVSGVGGLDVIRARQSEALIEGGVTVLSQPDAYVYMDRQAEALRRDLSGTGVDVVREGDGILLQLPSDITFAFDKSDIRERFVPVLEAVANTLNHYPATYVDVIGHTDSVGSYGYNQALSERRAASVAGFIQQRERIPARLYVAGRGKLEPIESNATVQGRAANRRVEILLHPYTAG